MHVIQFADENIKLTKRESLGFGLNINGDVLTLMFARHYSIRLWSEVKKSGKTFLATVIAIWEAVTNPDCEVVCCANDQEQAVSRVFQTVCQLIKYNPELTSSAMIQATQVKFTNGSVIRAVSSDYKGQAGGRQRLTIFDEIWAFDHERMTRLFEEMTPPPTEPGASLFRMPVLLPKANCWRILISAGWPESESTSLLKSTGLRAVHVLEPQAEATVAGGSRGARLL